MRFLVQRVIRVDDHYEYCTRVQDSGYFNYRSQVSRFIDSHPPRSFFLVTEFEEEYGGGSWQGLEIKGDLPYV